MGKLKWTRKPININRAQAVKEVRHDEGWDRDNLQETLTCMVVSPAERVNHANSDIASQWYHYVLKMALKHHFI